MNTDRRSHPLLPDETFLATRNPADDYATLQRDGIDAFMARLARDHAAHLAAGATTDVIVLADYRRTK